MKAHPRVSGENRTSKPAKKFATGSSPRERGKPAHLGQGAVFDRLIPA